LTILQFHEYNEIYVISLKKVKFSHEDIWRSGGISPPFLTSAMDEYEWPASCPYPFIPGEKFPGTHWIWSQSECFREEKKLTLPGMDPGPSAHNPSRCIKIVAIYYIKGFKVQAVRCSLVDSTEMVKSDNTTSVPCLSSWGSKWGNACNLVYVVYGILATAVMKSSIFCDIKLDLLLNLEYAWRHVPPKRLLFSSDYTPLYRRRQNFPTYCMLAGCRRGE
jgi:hypothetical protein